MVFNGQMFWKEQNMALAEYPKTLFLDKVTEK